MAEPALPRFAAPTPPDGWQQLLPPPPGTLWAAAAPRDEEDPDRFRPNLVLTCDDAGGLGFRDWQVGTDEVLPRQLHDYLLVDLERLEVDGLPGGRRLAHHTAETGTALTMEQWFTLAGDRGWTLTATVDTWHYDVLADACAAVAEAWRPVTGAVTDAG